ECLDLRANVNVFHADRWLTRIKRRDHRRLLRNRWMLVDWLCGRLRANLPTDPLSRVNIAGVERRIDVAGVYRLPMNGKRLKLGPIEENPHKHFGLVIQSGDGDARVTFAQSEDIRSRSVRGPDARRSAW